MLRRTNHQKDKQGENFLLSSSVSKNRNSKVLKKIPSSESCIIFILQKKIKNHASSFFKTQKPNFIKESFFVIEKTKGVKNTVYRLSIYLCADP